MIPSHAPFDPTQSTILSALLPTLSAEQKAWLSGFLAASQCGAAPVAAASKNLTVLYGTESGNSESLADKTVKAAKKNGFKAVLKNLADISVKDLAKFENIALIVSTWGDGEPPEAAEAFHKAFLTESVDLKGIKFSVCALGDTSYDKFCETGKEFDARLQALGAERIADRVDCDVDFDDSYAAWSKALFAALGEASAPAAVAFDAPAAAPAVEYGRSNPFPAEVIETVLLNGKPSTKETIHIELDLEGSGLDYEAGDALAVVPVNADDVVEAFLKAAMLGGDEPVEVKGAGTLPLKEALRTKLDITGLSRAVAKKYQALANCDNLAKIVSDEEKSEFKNWSWGREIIDLLELFPVQKLGAQALVDILRKLPIRLYSIASSPKAHPGEVHLTVGIVRYHSKHRNRGGVCSTFLADRADDVNPGVFLHSNNAFRLPTNGDTPVIMVGPGTGIAPFRAFLEERKVTEAKGGNWLFFGNPHESQDFLYKDELTQMQADGVLTKLSTAFSRDQKEKIYVQNRMLEAGADLWKWLNEDNASFYVCGDASRMAKDVDAALHTIAQEHGKLSEEEAVAFVKQLKKDKRYCRDVY